MRKYSQVILVISLIITGTILLLFFKHRTHSMIVGVKIFGNIAVGGETVVGRGSFTLAPYYQIPPAKFYVIVIKNGSWCINEDCSLDGALIDTMGGWLQVERTCCGSEIKEEIGLNLPENAEVKTLVVVSNADNRIVGIYPNRDLKDVLPILRLHSDLADFSLLEGVREFGALDIGEPAPLWPGDQIDYLSDKFGRYAVNHVPTDKKFYLYAIQKRKYDMVGIKPEPYENHPYENTYLCFIGSCRYPEPDPSHDFLFAHIEELKGWFLSNDMDSPKMAELFGLDQEEVLRGISSLVVLTDSKGTIVALHPGKTLADSFTILSQHPNLANMKKFYR